MRRALAGLLLLALAGCDGTPAPEATGPNVLLVVLDTLRVDGLSVYGAERETSPNLDRLAREGILFETAISVGASTAPVMSALMTGRLPYYPPETTWNMGTAHGMHRFFRDGESYGLPLSLDTLAEKFRAAGYRTAGFITNPYVKREYGFHQGFDTYEEIFPDESESAFWVHADQVTDAALRWLRAGGRRPSFLYLHYMDAHYPTLPPQEYRDAIGFDRVPGLTDEQLVKRWQKRASKPGKRPVKAVEEEHARGLYDASILYLDASLGRIFDHLAEEGLEEHTIVGVFSDHGEEFFEHGSVSHGNTFYDELVHVPMILRVPGVAPRRISGLVRNIDLGPTLLDFAGLPAFADGADARSLRPLIEGSDSSAAPPAFASVPTRYSLPPRIMVRTDRYKLILDERDPSGSELFDLGSDPGERVSLWNTRPDLVEELSPTAAQVKQKLASEAAASDTASEAAAPHGEIDSETADQLRALGYGQ